MTAHDHVPSCFRCYLSREETGGTADRMRAAAERLREEPASPLALALADWLDTAARDEEAGPNRGDRYPLRVADLILGDDHPHPAYLVKETR